MPLPAAPDYLQADELPIFVLHDMPVQQESLRNKKGTMLDKIVGSTYMNMERLQGRCGSN
uniref:Uncharacterized protein n=1 Tax=Aegilops tauschii TaxID=37682 RepID=M8BBA1_AEGTA